MATLNIGDLKIAITRKLEGILKFWDHMLSLACRDLQEWSTWFFKILTENGSKIEKTVFETFEKSKKRHFSTLISNCEKKNLQIFFIFSYVVQNRLFFIPISPEIKKTVFNGMLQGVKVSRPFQRQFWSQKKSFGIKKFLFLLPTRRDEKN